MFSKLVASFRYSEKWIRDTLDIKEVISIDISRVFGYQYVQFSLFNLDCNLQEHCPVCQKDLTPKPFKIAKHIFSTEHTQLLTKCSVDRREYNTWVNVMSIEVTLNKRKINDTATTTRIFENQSMTILKEDISASHHIPDSPPIDLIDLDIESELVPEDQRAKKLETLRSLWAKVQLKDLNASCEPRVTCYACNIPKDHYGTQLIEHIFTEKHIQFVCPQQSPVSY